MKETIEQYLARGGKVERLDPVVPDFKQKISQSAKQVSIMDLDEGAHFFSEFKPRKKKAKKTLDVSALPHFLKMMVKEE